MLADGYILSKCFGAGIAYPVRTKDGMIASDPKISNPRADSFSLYMGYVGDMILRGLLPKARLMKNTVHRMLPQAQTENQTKKGHVTQTNKK